ncbi:hypothetical protein [Flavobacterium sp. WV_118_3]|uniref:hypothetical protein n=1 Tax=Flavobacterium sp. WV_118_3 TaxID=3151764 RepID=UPI00321BDB4F
MIINGRFLSPTIIKSQSLDYLISISLLVSCFLVPYFIMNLFTRLEITDEYVQIEIFFFRKIIIQKEDVICSEKKENFSQYSMPNKYFVLKDQNNPKIRIKISEYYIQNYQEIWDYCQKQEQMAQD